jgi:hypothetical protein
MEYVHRCVVCDWQRTAASPTVTPPRCENCGCALESVRASEMVGLDLSAHALQMPERARVAILRVGAVLGALLLFVAAASAGYSEGGLAIAVTAVGVAGLTVVMAMSAERP